VSEAFCGQENRRLTMGSLGASLGALIRLKVSDFFDFRKRSFRFPAKMNWCLRYRAAVAEPRAKGAYTNIIAGSQSSVVGMNAAILL
jgi:hypothetical protein